MKLRFIHWTLAVLLTVLGTNAWANKTVTCTATNVTYTVTSYSPNTVGSTNTQLTFDVNCVRDNGATPGANNVTYSVAASNGQNPSGTQNRAILGADLLNYDFYVTNTGGTCSNEWNPTLNAFTRTYDSSAGVTDKATYTFYGCIPAGQTSVIDGLHQDTVVITITGSANSALTFAAPVNGAAAVNITVPKECALTTPPGTVDFGAYTALTGGAKTPNTPFITRCTNQGTYTMSLDNVNGVVAGLNYTLGLNTVSGSTGTATLASTGTGGVQTFYINGNMAGGQAGDCTGGACTGPKTNSHTLTITY